MRAAKYAGAIIRVAGDWATFVQDVVGTPPDACVLLESTLSQGGSSGLQAAEMTLHALGLRTVVALETDDPNVRFRIEMETEFTHFVVAPFTAESVRLAVNGTAPNAPQLLGEVAEQAAVHQRRIEPGSLRTDSSAQRVVTQAAPKIDSQAAPKIDSQATPKLDSRDPSRLAPSGVAHSVTATVQHISARATSDHTPISGTDVSKFFSPSVPASQLAELTSRVTAQNDVVPKEMMVDADSDALPSLEEFMAQEQRSNAPERAWTRDSVTAVANARQAQQRALHSAPSDDAVVHASAMESEADALDFSGLGSAEEDAAARDLGADHPVEPRFTAPSSATRDGSPTREASFTAESSFRTSASFTRETSYPPGAGRQDIDPTERALQDLDDMLPELDLLPGEFGAAAARPSTAAPTERAFTRPVDESDDEPIALPDESAASQRFRSSSVSGAAMRVSSSGAVWRAKSSSGAVPRVPSGAAERVGSGAARRVPSGAARRVPSGAVDRVSSDAVDRIGSGVADRIRSGVVPTITSSSTSGVIPRMDSGGFTPTEPPHLRSTSFTRSQSGDARAVSGATGRVAITTPTNGELFTIALPDPNGGSIDAVSVPQIMYSLSVAQATGELTLSTSSLSRRVVFFHGEPGTVFQVPTADDERKLLSTFGWASGTYTFEVKDVPEAQFHTFGEPMQFIFRGVQRHFGLNETATALGPYLKQYLVSTDQASRFRRILGLEGLGAFTKTADGTKTLEQLMGSGADTEALLRHAYFAWLTGAVVCTDQPVPAPLVVQYEVPELTANSGERLQQRRRTITLQPEREAASPAPPVMPSGVPAVDAHQQTFERLGNQWDVLASRSPYEVFGLIKGCGADEVNRRFYELVREYHPDRYARIQNTQIRTLAEKVFVQIRNLHTELLATERNLSHVEEDQSEPSESGAHRRRRRSTRGRTPTASGSRRATTLSPPIAIDESVSGPHADASQPRKVGDVLNKLRARSGDHNSTLMASSVRKLNPDQLVRNAKSATEQGNFEKATELLELAKARGASGPIVEAYGTFLGYTQDRSRAKAVIEALTELTEEIPEEQKIARSQVLTLAGHTSRLEEDNDAATGFYQQATRAWSDNESASRWVRHLKRRQTDDKKKPFSSTLLNKLFTPKSK